MPEHPPAVAAPAPGSRIGSAFGGLSGKAGKEAPLSAAIFTDQTCSPASEPCPGTSPTAAHRETGPTSFRYATGRSARPASPPIGLRHSGRTTLDQYGPSPAATHPPT